MNTEQTEYFRSLLQKRLEELLSQADSVVSELRSQSGQEIEYLDRASEYANQAMKLRIRTRESRLIKKILNALERLENDTYGICEACGEDISIKRLEARPVTTKCIFCKELEEQNEMLTQ